MLIVCWYVDGTVCAACDFPERCGCGFSFAYLSMCESVCARSSQIYLDLTPSVFTLVWIKGDS